MRGAEFFISTRRVRNLVEVSPGVYIYILPSVGARVSERVCDLSGAPHGQQTDCGLHVSSAV